MTGLWGLTVVLVSTFVGLLAWSQYASLRCPNGQSICGLMDGLTFVIALVFVIATILTILYQVLINPKEASTEGWE